MDWSAITSAISSIGFPIVAAIAMFYQVNKLSEAHKEEMNKLSETLNNNTIAIVRLTEKLEAHENE